MFVAFKGQLGASPSRTNRKARSPVTHIATANIWNCRKLLLVECRKCWLWHRSAVRISKRRKGIIQVMWGCVGLTDSVPHICIYMYMYKYLLMSNLLYILTIEVTTYLSLLCHLLLVVLTAEYSCVAMYWRGLESAESDDEALAAR